MKGSDGFAIEIAADAQPEALYDYPALLLVYDEHTPGAQPTPAPVATVTPQQKEVWIDLDATGWEVTATRDGQIKGFWYWSEQHKRSPDLIWEQRDIRDANGAEWRINRIHAVEEYARNYAGDSRPDLTRYTIELVNASRAHADFTGYAVEATSRDGQASGGTQWDPIEDRGRLGETSFTIQINAGADEPVSLRIWDTFEPALQARP